MVSWAGLEIRGTIESEGSKGSKRSKGRGIEGSKCRGVVGPRLLVLALALALALVTNGTV